MANKLSTSHMEWVTKVENNNFTYAPCLFEVDDLETAKKVILTPEQGTTTEERWEKETPYIVEQISDYLKPDSGSCILDYGCGVGRIAKLLIDHFNCRVVGMDISPAMRRLAQDYVGSERFSIYSPDSFDAMIQKGFSADHAIAVWVLQHCHQPIKDIFRIKSALKNRGRLYAVNNLKRAVPAETGWIDDGIDIAMLLRRQFKELSYSALPQRITTSKIAQHTFTHVLERI